MECLLLLQLLNSNHSIEENLSRFLHLHVAYTMYQFVYLFPLFFGSLP